MRYLDIAAVAQQSGVPASALRYYEEKGLIASVGRRGLRRLFDAGVHVTLNTDDPTFFSTTLNDEYRLAARVFGFDAAELATLALNGVRAAFLPEGEKLAMLGEFEREIGALRGRLL